VQQVARHSSLLTCCHFNGLATLQLQEMGDHALCRALRALAGFHRGLERPVHFPKLPVTAILRILRLAVGLDQHLPLAQDLAVGVELEY
jgi:hypothetical protein